MLLDTSAWIEFFNGSADGRHVKEALDGSECYTSIVTLAEIANWALKEKRDTRFLTNTIEQLSSIIKLDKEIATLAGQLNFERKKANKKWGMLDSFILATGMLYSLKILTKDSDYKDLEDVEVLR